MKTFLLHVDDSIHSTHAVQYILRMLPILQDSNYILFYVQPTISDYIKEECQKDPQAMRKLTQLDKRNAFRGDEILNRHKERMTEQGVPEEDFFSSPAAKEVYRRNLKQKVDRLLEKCRQILIDDGFLPEDISICSPERYCPSVTECILAIPAAAFNRRSRRETLLNGESAVQL
jgi:hypothetical protein